MKKKIIILLLLLLLIGGAVLVLMFTIPKKEKKVEEIPLEFPPTGVLGEIAEIKNETLSVKTENLVGDILIPKKEETPAFYIVQITPETKIYQFNLFILPEIPDPQLLLEEIAQEFAGPEYPDDIVKSLKEEVVGEFGEQGTEISLDKLPELIKEVTFDKLKVGDEIVVICEEEISGKEAFEAIRILLIVRGS